MLLPAVTSRQKTRHPPGAALILPCIALHFLNTGGPALQRPFIKVSLKTTSSATFNRLKTKFIHTSHNWEVIYLLVALFLFSFILIIDHTKPGFLPIHQIGLFPLPWTRSCFASLFFKTYLLSIMLTQNSPFPSSWPPTLVGYY